MLVYDNMAGARKKLGHVPQRSRMEEGLVDARLRRRRHRFQHHVNLPAPRGVLANLMAYSPALRLTRLRIACTLAMFALALAGLAAWQAPPPGRLVFIGTYTGEKTGSKGIYAFRFDDKTGALTPLGLKAETRNPSFLAAAASGKVLYAVNEVGDYNGEKAGSVTSFAVDRRERRAQAARRRVDRRRRPLPLQCDATGRFVAVANYSGGNFALFPVAPGRPARRVDGAARRHGLGPEQGAAAGTARAPGDVRPEQQVPARGRPRARQDLRLPLRSGVRPPDAERSAGRRLTPGSGPRHFAFHPNGRFVFAINELSSTMTSLAWDAAKGTLRMLGTQSTLPAGYSETSSTAESRSTRTAVSCTARTAVTTASPSSRLPPMAAHAGRTRADARQGAAPLHHRPDRPLADCRRTRTPARWRCSASISRRARCRRSARSRRLARRCACCSGAEQVQGSGGFRRFGSGFRRFRLQASGFKVRSHAVWLGCCWRRRGCRAVVGALPLRRSRRRRGSS